MLHLFNCRALATDDAFRDVLIAVDTFYAEVAHSAIAAGAHMVNDVSGGEFDENMHAEVDHFLCSAAYIRAYPTLLLQFCADCSAEL